MPPYAYPPLFSKNTYTRHMEDWVSGLNQRFTKPPSLNRDREFESHILRKIKKHRPLTGAF